eukprot:Nk52_evm5s171 gene=Nk52_evmTU5s171
MPYLVGYVRTQQDANLCFRAAIEGKFPLTTKRLTAKLRKEVGPQQIYVYDEIESGISRWTDGLHWCNSYASGEFIVYKEAVIVFNDGEKVKEEKLNGLKKRIIADKVNGSSLRLVCYTDGTTFATTADLKRNHNSHLETLRVSTRVLENPIVGGFGDEDDDHSTDLGADFYRSTMSYPHMMRSHSFENTPHTGLARRQSYGEIHHPSFVHSRVGPFNAYGTCGTRFPLHPPYSGPIYVDSAMVGRLPYEQRASSISVPSSFGVPGTTSLPRHSTISQSSANDFNVPNIISGSEATSGAANVSIMLDSLPHSNETRNVTTGASGFESGAAYNSSADIIANTSSSPTVYPVYNQASPDFMSTSFSGMCSPIDICGDSGEYLHRQSSVNKRITKTKKFHIPNALKRVHTSNGNIHSLKSIERLPSLNSFDGKADAVTDGRVPQFS